MLVNLSGSEKSAGRDTIGKYVTAFLGHSCKLCAYCNTFTYSMPLTGSFITFIYVCMHMHECGCAHDIFYVWKSEDR